MAHKFFPEWFVGIGDNPMQVIGLSITMIVGIIYLIILKILFSLFRK